MLSKGDDVGLREGATCSCSALIAFLQLSHKLPDAAIPPRAVKGQCCAAQMSVPAKSEKHSEIYWYNFTLDMRETRAVEGLNRDRMAADIHKPAQPASSKSQEQTKIHEEIQINVLLFLFYFKMPHSESYIDPNVST